MNQELLIYPDGRMDTENAARYMGFKVQTLANWRMQGKGPRFIKRGSRIWYYKCDIDEWMGGELYQSTAQARVSSLA